MKSAFRIILALCLPLAACGQSKPELFLDQTTAALDCASSDDPDCSAAGTPRHPSDADAGAALPRLDECASDADCEYGDVCDRRHGISQCQPLSSDGHRGDGGTGGVDSDSDDDDSDSDDDDSDSDDDSRGGDAGSASRHDAGSPGCAGDDHPKGADDCSSDGDDRGGDSHDDTDDDRSGSNSGPH